jgi:hypothetical protein
MDKKPLIGVSICAVVLLVLGSLSNVVGYQSKESKGMPESIPKMQMGPGYINWTVNGTMGENGWYISPLILTCTYDHDWWAHIYYDIGNGTTEYTEAFYITNQGTVTFMYIAVDYEGNEFPGTFPPFKIDYTPPFIDLGVEKTGFNKWLFSVIADDSISGVVNVEFYLDGQFLGNAYSAPYEYVWTGSGNHTVCAIAYDAAGNNASSSKNTPFDLNQFLKVFLQQQLMMYCKISRLSSTFRAILTEWQGQ